MSLESQEIEQFHYVSEWKDEFLSLFPHRYDYIYASHSIPGSAPNWQTESRHPLSDRILQQGAYLFGVRFGKTTNYCLLDIDAGSLYHPQRDRFAINRILASLEPLGLVHAVRCTSSYSGGLHLYLPFAEAQSTWELTGAVSTLLENAGFRLTPGQLELFPNPRPYYVDGCSSLFNAHRLPLQAGSYLLNQDLQPIWSDQSTFVQHWRFAEQRNTLDRKTIQQILKQFQRKRYRISGKAEKFLNDLNAEIERGWTGRGQTNRLLGRITLRTYIFQHILSGHEPLVGQALVEEIVNTAKSLPGYAEWCQHQHEIEHRATEWARCIEASRYFHYGDAQGKYKPKTDTDSEFEESKPLSWNQRQSQAARDRIRQAIADLLNQNSLPSNATARFHALTQYGIGGASLYRHRDLWHPNHLSNDVQSNNPSEPPFPVDSDRLASTGKNSTSLLFQTDGNCPPNQELSDLSMAKSSSAGSNGSSSRLQQPHDLIADEVKVESLELSSPLLHWQSWFELGESASQIAPQQTSQLHQLAQPLSQIDRMQGYLDSGDPILIAEALLWAEANPGILPVEATPTPIRDGVAEEEQIRELTDILAAIAVQIERLQLAKSDIHHHLWHLFSKRRQDLLDDLELAQWRLWLEAQPDPHPQPEPPS